jgi:LEA14-like dessication related protein
MSLKALHSWFLISVLFLVVGCSKPEQPEFISLKYLKVHEFTEEEVTLTGTAILFNPNSYSITVKEIDIFVKVNDQAVGKVHQVGEVKVPSNSEFEVPLNVTFAPQDVYDNLLSGLINYIMKGEFAVHYKGDIRVKVSGLVFKVPVDYKGNVKI